MSIGKANQAELGKIRSDFLRRETAEAHSNPHTVIVELSLPQAKVAVSPSPGIGFEKRRLVTGFQGGAKETKRHVSKARKSIEKILGHKTEAFFPSSSAFVVSATGEQLRELANLDLVSAIWPNDFKSGSA